MPEDPNAVVAAESSEEQPEVKAIPDSDESAAASAAAGETVKTPEEQAADNGKGTGLRKLEREHQKLTREFRKLEAERNAFREIALGKAPEKEKPAEVQDAAIPEPQAADFETTEEFMRANARWSKDEAKRELRAELKEQAKAESDKSEQETQAQEWQEQETAIQEKHADYNDVTAAAMETLRQSNTPACHAIAHGIQVSEAGPELLYHFGQHPEELEALAELHPTRAIIALGEIKARLAGSEPGEPAKPAAPPQTRAPRPLTPVKVKGSGAEDSELRDTDPPDVWKRKFLKKVERTNE